MTLRFDRIMGLFRRYVFIYMRGSFRILDVAFWPVMDLLVWGFVSVYFIGLNGSGKPGAVTFLIGAIILFNILYRSQQSVTISLLEDLWSRNLLNIFVAPITVAEFICATYLVGLAQVAFVGLSTSILAALLYHFNILSLGFLLVPLFLNLIVMGWSLGLLSSGLILRYGHQAEALCWALPYLVQPFSAVFYPISVLPTWLQPVSRLMPASYVFEGMRSVLQGNADVGADLAWATGLNVAYWIFFSLFYTRMLQAARNRGSLARLVS
ncbi:MAG: ABC transporter permease [Cyanobacteria bacterium SZAS TMP-1]|nr:ABC transporter permease [Cyanobacteria bacterium SZAS TMP-1]